MKFKSLIIAAAMLAAATFGGVITDGVLADEPEIIEQEVIEEVDVPEETEVVEPEVIEVDEPEVAESEPETPQDIIESQTGLVVDSLKVLDEFNDWGAYYCYCDGDIYCITIDGGLVDVCQILN